MSIKLFCFPYAGGSASMYVRWKQKLPEQIEVIPIELAGRGSRAGEKLFNDFNDLTIDVYDKVKGYIQPSDTYALFGFSMGGLIAYEVYRKLLINKMQLPEHLFVIGREAPNTDIFKVNHLNDNDFIEEIFSYDGMPEELYNNKEVLNYFMPILRADFGIHETYTCTKEIDKINCNITVWYGKNDKSIIHENVHLWKNFAGANFEIIELEGGHFFMKQHESTILDKVSNYLIKKL